MTNDQKRISRLAALLTHLQSKRIVTAPELARKFSVSTRTIYRDIKALEEANIPILAAEGRGYSLVEGYRLPPVMFTEREALTFITAEQIILRQKDSSFVTEYINAVSKIKSVLRTSDKIKVELVGERIFVGKNMDYEVTSSSLVDIQLAIANKYLITIDYVTENEIESKRTVEPYMLYHNEAENWILLAYCRSRGDFRSFRLDRINHHTILQTTFQHNEQRFTKYVRKNFLST